MPSNRIRRLREEEGLTAAQLAARIGVHESTVTRWETQATGIPDHRKVELAELFAVSIPFLMGWSDGEPNGGDGERRVA